MTKNEYKRSLILLRGNETGYSGHVRLERRVTTGSMGFVLQTPPRCESLRAALIGRDKRGYYACAIGDIRRDARGQGTLTYTFDPRNICGRELDMYRLIAVVRASSCGCKSVLLGNLNGYAEMDLNRALAAVCGLYGSEDAAVPAPVPPAAQPRPDPDFSLRPEAPVDPDFSVTPEPEIDPDFSLTPEVDPEFSVTPEPEIDPDFSVPAVDPGENVPDAVDPNYAVAADAQTAMDRLGDASLQWPAVLAGAQRYFREQPPAEEVPDDEYIYVRVPVDGLDAHLLTGVRADADRITGVAYALPADYTEDPPEGLSDYRWQGDDRAGWWVLRQELPPDA